MRELVSSEVSNFYKQKKDTYLLKQMIRSYQELVNYIARLNQDSVDNGQLNYGRLLSVLEKDIVNLTSILKMVKFKEIKENCHYQPERREVIQRIINRASHNQVLGNEAQMEEFMFVNESRIAADYYNLARYLLDELSTGKLDLKNHQKANDICQTRQKYLDICHTYMAGYYEYLTNYHNTKTNIVKTKLSYEIDEKTLESGYALLAGVLQDQDISNKLISFRDNYYISNSSVAGYAYKEKTLMEKVFCNPYASDTKWRLAASEAYDLVIDTVNKKQPATLNKIYIR